jgi:hypothetical protein
MNMWSKYIMTPRLKIRLKSNNEEDAFILKKSHESGFNLSLIILSFFGRIICTFDISIKKI